MRTCYQTITKASSCPAHVATSIRIVFMRPTLISSLRVPSAVFLPRTSLHVCTAYLFLISPPWHTIIEYYLQITKYLSTKQSTSSDTSRRRTTRSREGLVFSLVGILFPGPNDSCAASITISFKTLERGRENN